MKKILSVISSVLLCGALAGCFAAPQSNASSHNIAPSAPSASVSSSSHGAMQLVARMMELDYASMTVSQFNEAVQQIATEGGSNIFAVIADVYDEYENFDKGMETFMDTTLDYSSGQIFGEPVFLGNVAYITTATHTAVEMLEIKEQMSIAEYTAYYEGIIDKIDALVTVFYNIDFDIPDSNALTVAERDSRLNALRAQIDTYVVSMELTELASPTAKETLASLFETFAQSASDSRISIHCVLENIENVDDLI